jgi:hypothetical protein
MLNAECTRIVVRKFHFTQQVCLVRCVVAREATKKMLRRNFDALRKSIRLRVSTGRHVQTRSEASPKCVLEAIDEFWVAVTNEHCSRQSV